jgi:hypothetical protein
MPGEAMQQVFKCFVIMPFSSTEHEREGKRVSISKEEWAHIYSAWIKKAVESFTPHKFRCVRSPAAPGNFIRGIVRDLYDSDIVIADLTGSRANVYYELGIRHAMETGTIMITQDLASVPSDLHGYYTFQYHYTSEHHEYARAYADFEEQLHDKMVYIFDNLNPSDNPVSDFLGHSNEYLRQSFEGERNELVLLAKLLQDAVLHNYDLCDTIVKLATTGEHPEGAPPLVFDFFPFDLLLSRLVNTQWHFMPMQTILKFNELLQSIRRLFLPVHQGWQVLRINPTSEANEDFLGLVKAVLATRAENEREILEGIIKGAEGVVFTIDFTPRVEALREKTNRDGARKE